MNIQLDLSKTINNNNPIHLIVCCSGGADSMALLDMAYHYIHDQQEQSDKSNITLSVFHVKHGMSANQNDWAELVQRYGSSLGLDVYVANVNQEQNKLTETEARTKRYAALDKYIQILDKQLSSNTKCSQDPQDVKHTQDTKCAKHPKDTQFIVLTGHHKDDRLENFLISIFKNRVHNFDLVNHRDGRVYFQKPLLGYRKGELIHYCQSKNIQYVTDESNLISDNLRNIFRNQVFPFIEKLKNPKQYLTSLESFFDSYKVFHDFYILSVQDVKNKMMQRVKELDDGVRYSCSLDLIREKTGCSKFDECLGHIEHVEHNNQFQDNQQFYEFIGYLVLLFVNGDSNNNPVEVTYDNAVRYKFNQKDFVKKLPVLIKNESRYIVNEKVSAWIKNGNLFIKVKR